MARAGARVGAEAGTQASKTISRIFCKSFLEYIKISIVVTRVTIMGNFIPKDPVGCLENSDLEDKEESGGVIEGATKRYS